MSISEPTKPTRPSTWLVAFPFTLAVVDTLIVWRGMNTFAPTGSLTSLLIAIALVFGVSAIVVAFRLPTLSYWVTVALMLAGIALGIFIDVLVDAFLFSVDRNLFPFEIAFVSLVSFVPIATGAFIGRLLHAEW
jgi:hypothetical protein